MSEAVKDLGAFLSRLTDDTARLSFADWLDERHPATPVERDQLPSGFHKWWIKQRHHKAHWTGGPHRAYGWSNSEIFGALFSWDAHDVRWLDHGGASVIAGHPVLVGEPYAAPEDALLAAAEVQQVLRCPVSFSRSAAYKPADVRITVWFTFPFPEVKAS